MPLFSFVHFVFRSGNGIFFIGTTMSAAPRSSNSGGRNSGSSSGRRGTAIRELAIQASPHSSSSISEVTSADRGWTRGSSNRPPQQPRRRTQKVPVQDPLEEEEQYDRQSYRENAGAYDSEEEDDVLILENVDVASELR